jgi:hypothetical protein
MGSVHRKVNGISRIGNVRNGRNYDLTEGSRRWPK